jgi:hypothetical protein
MNAKAVEARRVLEELERRDRNRENGINAIFAESRRWGYTLRLEVRGTGDWTCRISSPRRWAYSGRGKTQWDALEAAWAACLGVGLAQLKGGA